MFALDSSPGVRRKDDCISLKLTESGFLLKVGVVVPCLEVVDTGFCVGESVEAVVGEFYFDREYNLVEKNFVVKQVEIEEGFCCKDVVEGRCEGFELELMRLLELGRRLKLDRVSNFQESREFSAGDLIDELMIFFNHKVAGFMDLNDVGAVYRVGIGDRSYEIGPYYGVEAFGYAYASSPLRSPEAYFNICNLGAFLRNEDYVSSSEMMRFSELDVFGVAESNFPERFREDRTLKNTRVVRAFYDALRRNRPDRVSGESGEAVNLVKLKNDLLLRFFANPAVHVREDKVYFDKILSDIELYKLENLVEVLFRKAPGNLVVGRYRRRLIENLDMSVFGNLYGFMQDIGGLKFEWGSIEFVNDVVEIVMKNGKSKKFQISDEVELRDFLYRVGECKFDLL